MNVQIKVLCEGKTQNLYTWSLVYPSCLRRPSTCHEPGYSTARDHYGSAPECLQASLQQGGRPHLPLGYCTILYNTVHYCSSTLLVLK